MAMVVERLCLFVSVVLFPRISFRIESYLKEEMEGRADLGRGPSPTRQTGRQPRHLRRRSFVFLFFFFFLFFACVLYRRNRNRSRSIQTVERAMECIILRVFFIFVTVPTVVAVVAVESVALVRRSVRARFCFTFRARRCGRWVRRASWGEKNIQSMKTKIKTRNWNRNRKRIRMRTSNRRHEPTSSARPDQSNNHRNAFDFYQFFWVLPDFSWSCRVLFGFTGVYWVLPSFTGRCLVFLYILRGLVSFT